MTVSECGCDRGSAPKVIESVRVVSNDTITAGIGVIALEAPHVARMVRPGQFVHVRIASGHQFILRRPFSVYRVRGMVIDILYQVVGAGTRELARAAPGTAMDIVGPLGHGWHVDAGCSRALIVSGGLGAAALAMLAEELARQSVATTVIMGATSVERLVGRELFERIAGRIAFATDDGSCGARGLVTGVCADVLAEGVFDIVYTCGPEAMQRRVAEQAHAARVACQVSLERMMACGTGVCLSCVVDTTQGTRRACVDGPVFWSTDVVWDSGAVA